MLLILLGIGILFWVLTQILRYRGIRKWRVVEGLVTQYSIQEFKQPQVYIFVDKIRPVVRYTYEIDGQNYVASRISLEDRSLFSDPDSKNIPWPDFAINSTIPVYVNPANLSHSVLLSRILPHRLNHYAAIAITAILLIMAGVCVKYVLI
jgi:hypothetical protein